MGISIGVSEEGDSMNFRDILGVSNLRHLRLVELLYACRIGLSSDQLLEELECSLSVLLKDVKLINSQQDAFRIVKYKGLYQLQINYMPTRSSNRRSFKLLRNCCMKSARILSICRRSFF